MFASFDPPQNASFNDPRLLIHRPSLRSMRPKGAKVAPPLQAFTGPLRKARMIKNTERIGDTKIMAPLTLSYLNLSLHIYIYTPINNIQSNDQ